MRLLLSLKHWQIFFLSWGPLSGFFIVLFINPGLILYYFYLIWFIFVASLAIAFAWVWAIGYHIKELGKSISILTFKIAFWIAFLYIWFLVADISFNMMVRKIPSINVKIELMIIMALAMISLICTLYGLFFIGRLVRTAELGKVAKVKEYLFESIVILFPPIGVWFIQPKVNRLISKSPRT